MNIRDMFLLKDNLIYLNHASTGIIPKDAIRRINDVINDFAKQGDPGKEYQDEILIGARRRIAQLINGKPENITFTMNTSHAIYIALLNIPLSEGDEVVVMNECFPAAKYIAKYNLPGINVKYVNFSRKDPVEVIKKNHNSRLKVVIVDHVQYFTGEKLPLFKLSNFLKEKNVFLIIDGIQAVGAINVDVKMEGIDMLACGGSKWLNGPQGTGFLYISSEIFNSLRKTHTGWLGAPWKDYISFDILPEPFLDARRFELGTRNIIGIAGLSESIRILLEYGPERVEKRIRELNTLLLEGLEKKKFEILTPKNRMAGIVTGRLKGTKAASVYKKLKENNIIISLRNNALRFSPHFYNTTKEIEKALEII